MKKSSLSEFIKECNAKGISYSQAQQLETYSLIKQLEKAKEKETENNSKKSSR